MKIKVLGKAHLEGISKKTNKPFNFNQIHYLGAAYGVEGQAAIVQILDSIRYPYETIMVGEEYNIEFDNRGFPVVFEHIDPKR